MTIPGLLRLELDVQPNDDGWFKENFHAAKLTAAGIPGFDVRQHNAPRLQLLANEYWWSERVRRQRV